jgi:hypothetical protein
VFFPDLGNPSISFQIFMRPKKGVMRSDKGSNFEALPVWKIFPHSIIGDFGTKQIDLDTSSLLHPGGSNAAQEPAQTSSLSRSA